MESVRSRHTRSETEKCFRTLGSFICRIQEVCGTDADVHPRSCLFLYLQIYTYGRYCNRIQRLQRRMDELGAVNMKALEDYETVLKRQEELQNRINTLSTEREQILIRMQGYEDLKKESLLKTR